jgi:hypothetical protein
MAVNMLESCAGKLVPDGLISTFLLECVKASVASPAMGAVEIIEDVACGFGDPTKGFLRQCKQASPTVGDKAQFSNTMSSVGFHTYLISEKYKDGTSGTPVVLPKVPVNTPTGLLEYQSRLAEITAASDWKNPDATLGKPLPAPSNCWITSNHFGADTNAPTYPHDLATEARDKLGLIDSGEGTFLLKLSFQAEFLANISGNEVARPVFCDLGNSRFRVRQSSSRAKLFAKRGWGATTHLGKLGDKSYRNSTGACERVSSALPLTQLENLTVEFLGRVMKDRGVGIHDDDKVYAKKLQAGRSKIAIKNELLSLLK